MIAVPWDFFWLSLSYEGLILIEAVLQVVALMLVKPVEFRGFKSVL